MRFQTCWEAGRRASTAGLGPRSSTAARLGSRPSRRDSERLVAGTRRSTSPLAGSTFLPGGRCPPPPSRLRVPPGGIQRDPSRGPEEALPRSPAPPSCPAVDARRPLHDFASLPGIQRDSSRGLEETLPHPPAPPSCPAVDARRPLHDFASLPGIQRDSSRGLEGALPHPPAPPSCPAVDARRPPFHIFTPAIEQTFLKCFGSTGVIDSRVPRFVTSMPSSTFSAFS
ncbi:hypothetical protein Hsar01_00170 [Haloferula sargassicola]|uniref:Uncharacterized protein n=1 Tax=Haloferula sargassicola TaxID=490096 RepID=A0ABP9UHH5_9BACT